MKGRAFCVLRAEAIARAQSAGRGEEQECCGGAVVGSLGGVSH